MIMTNIFLILLSMLLPFAISIPLDDFFDFTTGRTCDASQVTTPNKTCEIYLFPKRLDFSYNYQIRIRGSRFPYFSEKNVRNIYVCKFFGATCTIN